MPTDDATADTRTSGLGVDGDGLFWGDVSPPPMPPDGWKGAALTAPTIQSNSSQMTGSVYSSKVSNDAPNGNTHSYLSHDASHALRSSDGHLQEETPTHNDEQGSEDMTHTLPKCSRSARSLVSKL
ncbi:uncharacterized protein IL334_000527 [Kwoniella shivajii]|uniref:Uncharacterized protein n=1 Tax=Kwoniella shivajii TaxID=564305 RepID=A0ABZ1CQU9_9TREE|nr:hypothetical protein IL334_000527 [Kwoniella shivajii]